MPPAVYKESANPRGKWLVEYERYESDLKTARAGFATSEQSRQLKERDRKDALIKEAQEH